jgi:hypothetical protein
MFNGMITNQVSNASVWKLAYGMDECYTTIMGFLALNPAIITNAIILQDEMRERPNTF